MNNAQNPEILLCLIFPGEPVHNLHAQRSMEGNQTESRPGKQGDDRRPNREDQ